MILSSMPYDIYERHRKVGSYIQKDDTVLDIGGELNHLSLFCSPKTITVANLNTGDVIITKDKLPFKKGTFDVVCSIDVLEHIPKKMREDFVQNLCLVARKKVILSFPIGTKRHAKYELDTLEWLTKRKHNVAYLKEHIAYGLPTIEEVRSITTKKNISVSYSGNIVVNKILFRLYMFDPKIKFIRRGVFFLKKIFNFLTNQIFYFFLINKNYSDNINRAYVLIKVENS